MNYNDRYYDMFHPVARTIRQCLFVKLFFTVFSMFTIIGFYKSTEFEFEFAQRIPSVSLIELPALIFRNWVHFKQIYV